MLFGTEFRVFLEFGALRVGIACCTAAVIRAANDGDSRIAATDGVLEYVSESVFVAAVYPIDAAVGEKLGSCLKTCVVMS